MSQTELPKRFLEAAAGHAGRNPPPVEKWNPAYCGEIDMRIARDGRWFYLGTPITRLPLVKLFASILRRDPERYVLVTPVERVGIVVEDAPFLAVEMAPVETSAGPAFAFRTNLDEIVVAGADHPMRFELDQYGGLKPYLHVRGGLFARATRSLALDLAAVLTEDAQGRPGLASAGAFFALPDEALEVSV
ncbi:MAG: DUF1285 domain-containing protein [Proteobacteria bacterium]|nr:DUF1285 domain-containing protein [Pseudomonadota bacterium]